VRKEDAAEEFGFVGCFEVDGRSGVSAFEELGLEVHAEPSFVFVGVVTFDTGVLEDVFNFVNGSRGGENESGEDAEGLH